MHNYKKLKVWEKSLDLATTIYDATKEYPKEEKFGIVSQMRRSAVSISSNIAEGAGRSSDNEFRQFLNIAFGSCSELETQLIISHRLNYIQKKVYEELSLDLTEVQKMIFTLIKKFS
ncbi:MAG: four helix bundle protein [Balneolaceae bacterium]|nr:four helix bundle protein [Balneolaceae bacterium]